MILILVVLVYYYYFCFCFKKLPSKIPPTLLFPSQYNIDHHNIILYSRVNINGENTLLINRDEIIYKNVKEHTERDKKIKLYINNRISSSVKKKLIHWVNHTRYKPGSKEYYNLVKQYKI